MVGSPRPRLPSPHRPRPTPTWPGLLQPGSRHPRLAVRLHHPPGLDPDLAGYRPGTPPPPVRPGRARPRARAVPAAELLAFLDADHPLRDKTPWWLAVRDRRPAPGRGPRPQHRRSGTWRGRRAVVVGRGRPSRGHRLGDQDCPLLPRHLHSLASLAIYAKPTFDAVAAASAALAPRPTTLTSTTCQSHTG